MIYFPSTKANISTEFPVAAGLSIDAEGMALIASVLDGVFGAKAAAGGASEIFLGVSVSQQTTLTSATKVEEFVQPVSNTVTVAFTPTSGTISVYNATTGAQLVETTDWTSAAKVITLGAGTAGHNLVVHYAFVPNANQMRALQGDTFPGGPAGAALGQIGVIRNGIVYTDQYDTDADWTANNPVVKTAAGGKFTIGGSGTTLANVSVIGVPSAGFPYLGLLIN